MKKIIFVIGALLLISISACADKDVSTECKNLGGKWISDAQECENISKENCDKLGGDFNECASACRNDPNAEICTMQCVLVCSF